MKISIITVCKNAKDALPRTMDSVLSQTYPDIEYIVIDGASDDGTLELLKEYETRINGRTQDSPLQKNHVPLTATPSSPLTFHWISEPDSGIYEAMNKGIDISSGDYLLFLNAGDYLHDERVLADVFSCERLEDILYGDIVWVDREKGSREHSLANCVLNEEFFFYASLPHPCTFIKKDVFDRYGKYDESLSIVSDWEFWIRTVLIGCCITGYVQRTISDYDLNGISSDGGMLKKHKSERLRVILKYYSGIVAIPHALRLWAESSASEKIICLERAFAERVFDRFPRSYRLKNKYRYLLKSMAENNGGINHVS